MSAISMASRVNRSIPNGERWCLDAKLSPEAAATITIQKSHKSPFTVILQFQSHFKKKNSRSSIHCFTNDNSPRSEDERRIPPNDGRRGPGWDVSSREMRRGEAAVVDCKRTMSGTWLRVFIGDGGAGGHGRGVDEDKATAEEREFNDCEVSERRGEEK
jgi:hypothetical protein